MKVLILGGSGQVGLELQATAWPSGVSLAAPTRSELDLLDDAAVTRYVADGGFGAVVNAAAYTAVDQAEQDVTAAWRLNAVTPATLAAATAKASIPLVHISTDYVFDGRACRAYEPLDPVAPLNVYGASKEGGEQAVRTANRRHVILRTAWVVGRHRKNFVKTMLRLAAERPVLRVVDDQIGNPTLARDLAAAIAQITLHLASDPDAQVGTFHFVNQGDATWCDFARAIMAMSSARAGPSAPVEPTSTSDFPTPARRPSNSRLSTRTLTSAYGVTPRAWTDGLGELLDDLLGSQ